MNLISAFLRDGIKIAIIDAVRYLGLSLLDIGHVREEGGTIRDLYVCRAVIDQSIIQRGETMEPFSTEEMEDNLL